MKSLYLKKSELCRLSKELKTAKWRIDLSKDDVAKLIEVQNDAYKRYNFYKEFLKKRGEVKNGNGKLLCIKKK